MTTYTLHLTEEQARVISRACELLARLGIGQIIEGLHELPQKDEDAIDWTSFNDDCKAVCKIMSKYMPNRIDGYNSNLGIHNAGAGARRAWDLHQVIRYRLSWDHAIAQGWTDGTKRNWNEMLGVSFDKPMHVSGEELARMEKQE